MAMLNEFPRPWRIGNIDPREYPPEDDGILAADGEPVLWWEDGIDSPEDEVDGLGLRERLQFICDAVNAVEANAHGFTFVASSELLEACEMLLIAWAEDDLYDDEQPILRLKAAVKKAKGEK